MSNTSEPFIQVQDVTPKRHPEFYFDDGTITFLVGLTSNRGLLIGPPSFNTSLSDQVENHLFRVHRHFFVRESAVFRDMLSIPSGPEMSMEGLSDDKPIALEDVKSLDFERMMWMFYNEFVALAPCLQHCS